YRGLDDEKVYYNNDYRGFVMNHRSTLNSLAEAFYEKGDKEKAHQVVMFSLERMPDKAVPYDFTAIGMQDSRGMVELLFLTGEKDKAVEMARTVGDRAIQMVNYLRDKGQMGTIDFQRNLYILESLQYTLFTYGEEELAKKYDAFVEPYRQADRRDY
ncbi:MAG: DUF2723 domain-containing protein, partial [Cyclobacteriaceae bacterium]|nr:DUF2723 domain-containing protein [Cyclobacteriaceae bacterium]